MSASVPGSVKFGKVTRAESRNGAEPTPHAFVLIDVYTPNGVLRVEVDAGEFSKALARPDSRAVATLSSLPEAGSAA